MTVREAAERYRKQEFAICRIQAGKKLPLYPNWTQSRLEPDDFGSDDNIGIMTGHLSGDLVCVDLDAPEALKLADQFLPPTDMVDGRSGNPASHRWYRVTDIPEKMTSTAAGGIGGPKTRHFKHAKTKQNILDFLGTGAQAVVPPSLHPSGERRIWHKEGEPAVLTMKELWRAVCKLARACGWEPKRKVERPRKNRRLPITEAVRAGEEMVQRWALARSGHGGHNTIFRLARDLEELGLPQPEVRRLLGEFNKRLIEAGEEPWTEEELDHKVEPNPTPALSVFQPELPANDPYRLAPSFLKEHTWVYWNNLYWEYNGKRYVQVPVHEANPLMMRHIKKCLDEDRAEQYRRYQEQLRSSPNGRHLRQPPVVAANKTMVRNALMALEDLTLRRGTTTMMPSRLSDGKRPNWLALENGLLDLDTRTLRPHTPDWFAAVCLPYAYDPAAQCDRWLDVLNRNLEGDDERIALLQEFSGYLLNNTTAAQAYLILVGDGGNGKSVALAGLQALLGDDNVSAVPLEDFGKRFAMAQTLGKLANIAAEIGEIDRTAEGVLKSFTSGDPMTFEQKGKDAFRAMPTARLVLSTNTPPRVADRTDGVWRRLNLIPFNRKVPDSERIPGMDKAAWWLQAGEAPGIMNWALEGWHRLKANNMRFTEPAISVQAREDHRLDSDPCRAFLTELFTPDDQAAPLPVGMLYQEYKSWCEENTYKPIGANKFGQQVVKILKIDKSEVQRVNGSNQRVWLGIARKSFATHATDCNRLMGGSVAA